MKKQTVIIFIAISLVIGIFVGFFIGQNVELTNSVVGVYKTDSWNGKTGTLILYEDGTGVYPSGAEAKWSLEGDTVQITREVITMTPGTYSDTGESSPGKEVVNIDKSEAKIIEQGLVLNGIFFEKVN
jgi:hypothetical protein